MVGFESQISHLIKDLKGAYLMVKVVIGSIVLCHLLLPGKSNTPGEENITKILGEVVDIQQGSRYIEKVQDKQALRADTNILMVKGQNVPGIYQIDSRACMAVRDETDEERENRLHPKVKKVEEVTEEVKEEESAKPEVKSEVEKSSADIEVQDRPSVEDSPVVNHLPEMLNESEKSMDKEKVMEPKVEEKAAPMPEPEVAPAEKKSETVEPAKEDKPKSLLDYIK